MGLTGIPAAERTHIGFFGKRNAGKSSLINAVTGQSLSIVSDVKGTTTDPVLKTMEILPLGPVVIIDTPGIDDEGELGTLRVEKSFDMLRKSDIAVLVVEAKEGLSPEDEKLLAEIKKRNLPYIICYSKCDEYMGEAGENEIYTSAKNNVNIFELKEMIAGKIKSTSEKRIVGDMIDQGDIVILVIPIDESAPKGRLILPQQLTIRDILDKNASCICLQPDELADTLNALNKKPALVITDSQVFGQVSKTVPEEIPLTSFSILMLRYKGEFEDAFHAVKTLDSLQDGDKILISEGCTHHRQCNDIGTVKLPSWIEDFTGKRLQYEFSSGTGFPGDLSPYRMIIHCGGCMLNEKEMKNRMNEAKRQGVPISNYGMVISYVNGILERATRVFEK
ncbi:MAG: [Firmicutes bacterium]|nr:[FeFe] hydrogenase H-cluster maturation GTPase HydF [Bacillota bacterium]